MQKSLLHSERVLKVLGLERRKPITERVLDVAAFVTLGVVVGVGVGLLFARKPGAQLRAELRELLPGSRDPLKTSTGSVAEAR